jgi:hypothetical protein
MRQTKGKWILGAFILALTLALTGCKEEPKGQGFVGNWVEVDKKSAKEPPMTLKITYEQGIFHIDEVSYLFGKSFNKKLEAKAESDTVLSLFENPRTLRLENNSIFYHNKKLVKSK